MSSRISTNIADLSGILLDYAVAYARSKLEDDELHVSIGNHTPGNMAITLDVEMLDVGCEVGQLFEPSTNGTQGSMIIERNKISVERAGDGWAALYNDTFCPQSYAKASHGPTFLIAAMRCYVAHVFGTQVDLPVAQLFEIHGTVTGRWSSKKPNVIM